MKASTIVRRVAVAGAIAAGALLATTTGASAAVPTHHNWGWNRDGGNCDHDGGWWRHGHHNNWRHWDNDWRFENNRWNGWNRW